MKNTYIIPGIGSQAQEYDLLFSMIESKGSTPIAVPIQWESRSWKQWVSEAQQFIDHHRANQSTSHESPANILGFSYGGSIALFIESYEPDCKIYCSAFDVFNKGLRSKFDNVTLRKVGITTLWDVDELSMATFYGVNRFLYGGKESPTYKNSALDLIKKIESRGKCRSVRCIEIPAAGHAINSPEYVDGLECLFSVGETDAQQRLLKSQSL